MSQIRPGRYYAITEVGLIEIHDGDPDPHVWICRRVADFKADQIPNGAAMCPCSICGAEIAFNPARQVRAPKSCMQCAGITPEPLNG